MIIGTYSVPRVVEESVCKITEDYYLSEIGDYKVYSAALMPLIQFEDSAITKQQIDGSVFVNDRETKLTFDQQIDCQNFLTTKYIGRAPLEFYGPKTKKGREFIMICRDGDPSYKNRTFGSSDAMAGVNRNVSESVSLPRGE